MNKSQINVVRGNLLDQKVDVIVNAWNRNIIPWWLLIPQGVSGAIKRQAGLSPFRQLGKYGPMQLGEAVFTDAGRLLYKGIIHVAGINMLWRSSEYSIRESIRNAMSIVNDRSFKSVAFPVIGAGSGGYKKKKAQNYIMDELLKIESSANVVIVEYQKKTE